MRREFRCTCILSSPEGDEVSESASVLVTQIERVIERQTFRGTPHAQFKRTDGFFLVDAWFQDGEPRMQIRSSAHSLEEAATIVTGIKLAQDWIIEETEKGNNLPSVATKETKQ